MTRHASFCAPVLMMALMILPATAAAQETTMALEPAPPARLAVDLKTGVWFPRLGGKVALGANSGNPNIDFDRQFDLANSEIAINAELTLRFDDRWFVRGSGFDFSTDTRSTFVGNETFGSVTLNNGEAFDASLDMLSVAVEVGLDLFRPLPNRQRPEPSRVSLRVSGLAGLRYLGVDQDVNRTAGGSASAAGNWTALYAGAEIELRWATDPSRPTTRALVFDAGVGVGADVAGGGLLVHVRAELTLEFSDHIGAFFGYRLMEVDFEDAPYGFDAGLQGVFVGGSIRF